MAVIIPGIPGCQGMTYIMRDWWKKKSINVLYASVIINFLLTAKKMKNTETT